MPWIKIGISNAAEGNMSYFGKLGKYKGGWFKSTVWMKIENHEEQIKWFLVIIVFRKVINTGHWPGKLSTMPRRHEQVSLHYAWKPVTHASEAFIILG